MTYVIAAVAWRVQAVRRWLIGGIVGGFIIALLAGALAYAFPQPFNPAATALSRADFAFVTAALAWAMVWLLCVCAVFVHLEGIER